MAFQLLPLQTLLPACYVFLRPVNIPSETIIVLSFIEFQCGGVLVTRETVPGARSGLVVVRLVAGWHYDEAISPSVSPHHSISSMRSSMWGLGQPLNSIPWHLTARTFSVKFNWQVDDSSSFLFCNTDIAVSMIWHKCTYEFQIQGYWKKRFWNKNFQILHSHKNHDSCKMLTFIIISHCLQHLTLQSRNISA